MRQRLCDSTTVTLKLADRTYAQNMYAPACPSCLEWMAPGRAPGAGLSLGA